MLQIKIGCASNLPVGAFLDISAHNGLTVSLLGNSKKKSVYQKHKPYNRDFINLSAFTYFIN